VLSTASARARLIAADLGNTLAPNDFFMVRATGSTEPMINSLLNLAGTVLSMLPRDVPTEAPHDEHDEREHDNKNGGKESVPHHANQPSFRHGATQPLPQSLCEDVLLRGIWQTETVPLKAETTDRT
jgi:hypothetical protein